MHMKSINSNQVMEKIPLVTRLAVDATFKSSPGQFYQVFIHHNLHCHDQYHSQLLIINGFVGTDETGVWTPLFYCLMPRKTRADYNRLYSGLSEVRLFVLAKTKLKPSFLDAGTQGDSISR